MRRLAVELFAGPVQRAPGDSLLVPLPEDERPLRGDAGIVDWRLEGQISELVASGFCSGKFGEATLLPGGRGVAAERVLLFGIGRQASLYGHGLERAFTLAGAKLTSIRAVTGVLALPEGMDLERGARGLLVGLGRAITLTRAAARLAIVIPATGEKARVLRRVWPDVSMDLKAFGIEGVLGDLAPRGAELPIEAAS